MFDILYENDDFIIIDKFFNTNIHNQNDSGLFFELKKIRVDSDLHLCHRLDYGTSGIMIIAKNRENTQIINKLFEEKQIEKYYIALSDKKPKKSQGTIKGDLVQSRSKMWKLAKTYNNPSITKFYSFLIEKDLRAFIIRLFTGKTHQIRVVMKSLGSPVMGDELYGSKENNDRMYLHCFAICFTFKNESFKFTNIPKDGTMFKTKVFTDFIEKYDKPWELKW